MSKLGKRKNDPAPAIDQNRDHEARKAEAERRRLTPGERDIHAADHEHWDMHRPVIASGLKILLDGQSKVDEGQLRDQRGGLSKDLEEMYSVLDELDEEDGRAD